MATVAKAFKSRGIARVLENREQAEGVGARVRRSIGGEVDYFDPFLLLDHFKTAPPAGFPDHPHRGFETVTYMHPNSEGLFKHEDFAGHMGVIGGGDLQWMTAGRGIVHCELPQNNKVSDGLQLWVNLPKSHKMTEPRYQELPKEKVPIVEKDGVTARVIAGEALGVKSPVYTITEVYYTHFTMQPGSVLQHAIPPGFNAFMYVIGGTGTVGPKGDTIEASHTVLLNGDGEGVEIHAKGKKNPYDFVVIAGKPLNEPMARRGVFVMNTKEELQTAFEDLRNYRNGFEKYKGWHSKSYEEFKKKMKANDDDEL